MATINYETVLIAEPEIAADQVDQLINKIKQTVTSHQGTMTGEDRWGRRRLAYPVHGHREGFYSVLTYSAEPTVVAALEHLFNVTDSVIRQLTIRVIKKNKTFAPRRERPTGAASAEGHRPSGRYGGSSRPRPETAPRSSVAPAEAARPASAPEPAAPAAPAEPASVESPRPSPEGGSK